MQYYKLQYPERKWRSEVQNMLGFVSNVHHNNFILKFHLRLAFVRQIRLAITQSRDTLIRPWEQTHTCAVSASQVDPSLEIMDATMGYGTKYVPSTMQLSSPASPALCESSISDLFQSVWLTESSLWKKSCAGNPSEEFHVVIREVSLFVFQRETRCTRPCLGTRTVVRFWTTYVNHAESELSAWFETRCISVHFARFRAVSSLYFRSAYHPRYETMEIHQKGTETAAHVSWLCQPVARPFLVNEQRTAKSSRPTNVAWTTYVVHSRNTYSETSLLLLSNKVWCYSFIGASC